MAALCGLGLAVGLAGHLQRPAPPGQVPGAMTALGLDARGPFLQVAALIALPWICALAAAALARRRGRRLAAPPGPRAAPPAPEPADQAPEVASQTPQALGVGRVWSSSRARRLLHGWRLSRADLLLIPAAIVAYFAILDLAPQGTRPAACLLGGALLMLAIRAAAGALSPLRHPAAALAPAPLAILLQVHWLPARGAAVAALAWIVAAPLAAAGLLREAGWERRLRRFAVLAVYPLFVTAYPLALLGIGSTPRLDFFEDGHELLPAAEMLRGSVPYADIVPAHSLVADGALDLLVMKSGHLATGDVLRVRQVLRCLYFPALYAVGWAAAGAAEAGLLSTLLALALFPALGLRPAPALLALACAAAAVRHGARWSRGAAGWLVASGVLAAVAFCVSPDLAGYSAAVAVVAAVLLERRGRALAALAAGAGAAAAAILGGFAALGFAGAFLRVTFGEIFPSGRAYIIGPLAVPGCLRTLAGAPGTWQEPDCLRVLLWLLAVVLTAAALARGLRPAPATWSLPTAGTERPTPAALSVPAAGSGRPVPTARSAPMGDGVWLIGLWIAVAGASYAERRHFYANYAMAAFLIGVLWLLARARAAPLRGLAVALSLGLLWLSHPLRHLLGVAAPLRTVHAAGPPAGVVEIAAIPRCRGVWIDAALKPPIESAARFAATHLRPGETWLDFTNHPSLYYLLDRRCPIRHVEIPFLESAALQREVIAGLRRDPSVRAVLIGFPDRFTAIDGVANAQRAPLLWSYLEKTFQPAFAEDGVVFWTRR